MTNGLMSPSGSKILAAGSFKIEHLLTNNEWANSINSFNLVLPHLILTRMILRSTRLVSFAWPDFYFTGTYRLQYEASIVEGAGA